MVGSEQHEMQQRSMDHARHPSKFAPCFSPDLRRTRFVTAAIMTHNPLRRAARTIWIELFLRSRVAMFRDILSHEADSHPFAPAA